MKSNNYYQSHYSPYPGEYLPMPQAEDLLRHIKKHEEHTGEIPMVNIKEYEDHYQMEVDIPGVSRENIFLDAGKNILSVIIMEITSDKTSKDLFPDEFENRLAMRHVLLPANADTEFVSAEYRHGMLCVHIPKCKGRASAKRKRIIVY